MIAWDMTLGLEEAGFKVCGIAGEGAKALAQVGLDPPDLVLMDVNLKGSLDGIETAVALRTQVPNVPIIFVTGFGDPDTAARIRSVNPAGYLLKPVDPEEL